MILAKNPLYRFKLQQKVRLVHRSTMLRNEHLNLEYEIVRLMPLDESGEVSYRIKSGSIELAVREHQIIA